MEKKDFAYRRISSKTQKVDRQIDDFLVAYNKWKNKKCSAVKAYESIGMAKSTWYKKIREYEKSL